MGTDLYQAAGQNPSPQPGQLVDLYDAAQNPQTYMSALPPNPTNWLDASLHKATGGLIDKVDAAAQTALYPLMGGIHRDAAPFWDRYRGNLHNLRNDYGEYDEANPEAAKVTNTIGLVAPMALGGPELKLAGEAPSILGTMFKGAKTGAKVGAAYGFGSTDDSSVTGDLEATGFGGLLGLAGGATVPAISAFGGVPFRAAGKAISSLRPDAAEGIAGNILNKAAGDGPINWETAPIPGMKPTLGQATNNQGLLWFERSLQQGSPLGAEIAAKSKTANNGAITTAINSLGNAEADFPATMAARIEAADKAAKLSTRAAWAKAGVDDATAIPTAPLKLAMGGWYNGLTKAERMIVPGDLFKPLDQFGDQESLAEMQSLRANIGDEVRQAARAGQGNKARILGGAADAMSGFLDNLPDAGSGSSLNTDPSVMANYNAARAATADYKKTFNQPEQIRNVLGVDRFGADKTPISATADKFMHSASGGPEDFVSYLKATQGDPLAAQAARDAFTNKFLDAVQGTKNDLNATPLASNANLSKFLDKYQHVINSPIFTPDQRQMIQSIQKASDMTSRSGGLNTPGSDTFQKLAGKSFLDVLIGPHARKLVVGAGTAAGAAISHSMGEGMFLSAMGGGASADALIQRIYSAPRDRVVKLITEAVHDPDLARALMYKASAGNSKLLKPTTRAKMLGILGGETGRATPQFEGGIKNFYQSLNTGTQ